MDCARIEYWAMAPFARALSLRALACVTAARAAGTRKLVSVAGTGSAQGPLKVAVVGKFRRKFLSFQKLSAHSCCRMLENLTFLIGLEQEVGLPECIQHGRFYAKWRVWKWT